MLKDERRIKILEVINKEGFAKNINLSRLTNSTIQTVITDINELHNEGLLIKVYGGAKSITINNNQKNMPERFDEEKDKLNIEAKDKIAKKAASMINDGDLVFLDTGTTTKRMVKYLLNKKIKIVTNGYSIALALIEQDMEVYFVGGRLIPSTHASAGELALKFLDNFFFDKAFLGSNGLANNNFYTTNISEAMIKEKVSQNSHHSWMLMDSSKFNLKNRIKIELKKETVLISEKEPSDYNREICLAKFN
ncbi:DeoR family transcriptional regulator [Entomoplasma freundtii]|uniref:DeoR family transcriptional regulator n=1 Tax=Entomoplasma freundtii TaxID=74700 RepID=A0A2K8NQU4_9MOLU|nr:DeoR/GlpR family DNA-binding transcription regulator [Entomoplasma freundtii]ATZ16210.1 DeoR family transcriptional regulator [Entomoplasma freundtii]TDY56889.1 DeoR family transcriptional regulator [Entomoplasma freundtii]